MLFSIIVPTCHRNDLLAQCLERLAPGAQTQYPADYEVIVTDDGVRSTAESLIREQFPWALWVAGPRLGPAANRNHGASRAHGEWLVFVDDDCLPDLQLLSAYAAAIIANPDVKVLEGRINAEGSQRSLAEWAPVNDRGGYLWACNFAIQHVLFSELGGFDQRFRFPAMEDVDFRLRLQDRKCPIMFTPLASVCHPWRIMNPIKAIREIRRHRQAVEVFVSLHPHTAEQFNLRNTLFVALRSFVKVTLPGALRYRGRGLMTALTADVYLIYSAAIHPLKASP